MNDTFVNIRDKILLLYTRKAFVQNYLQEGMDEEDMRYAYEQLEILTNEYNMYDRQHLDGYFEE